MAKLIPVYRQSDVGDISRKPCDRLLLLSTIREVFFSAVGHHCP